MAIAQYEDLVFDSPDGDFSKIVRDIHIRVLSFVPSVTRVAVASYDPGTDLIKTFAASTLNHDPISFHEACLRDVPTLAQLAREKTCRVVDDLRQYGYQRSEHTAALVEHGFLSSATLPIHQKDKLLGFVFINASEVGVLRPYVEGVLMVYANLLAAALQKYRQSIDILQGALTTARTFTRLRDEETSGHLSRMSRYARTIAWNLREELNIDQEFVENVFQFSPLHDIGKVGTPDNILLKPGRLNYDEVVVMQDHVNIGAGIINAMVNDFSLNELPGICVLRNIVQYHHERWDGNGYPHGVMGGDIPLEARITMVADVFDALTSVRPYKNAWSLADAAEYLQDHRGSMFDPLCVDALFRNEIDLQEIHGQFAA